MVVNLPQPAILSDPAALTRLLLWIIVVMLASLAFLFLRVVYLKLRIEREHAAEGHAATMLRAALDGGTPLAALRIDPARIAEWRALALVLAARPPAGGEAELRAAPWFDALLASLQRELQHEYWGRRASACEALGLLPVPAVRAQLVAAAKQESHPRAYAACLHAIARHTHSDDEMRELTALLGGHHVLSGSFNESIFRAWIRSVRARDADTAATTRLDAFLQALRATPLLQLDAIAAIGRDGPTSMAPALAALAASDASTSLRIACTRAIGQLDPAHPALLTALDDPAWQVQAVAARHLRSATEDSLAALQRLLTHANFHVRRNASLALGSLGAAGAAVLRAAAGSSDRYAAALARYTLESAGAGHG